jgi:ADP-heptose:LPS heptosyltransferase
VVLVLSGPADAQVVRAMTSRLSHSLPILSDAPLSGLAGLFARCSAYLGNDSGITHLAGLAGAPVVALFGPTDPAVWGPRGARVTTLRWQAKEGELPPEKVAHTLCQIYSA